MFVLGWWMLWHRYLLPTSSATLVFSRAVSSVLFSPSGLPAPPLPRNVFLRAAVESVPHPRVPIPEGAMDLWSLYHAKLPVLRSLSAMGVQRCGVQRDVFSQFESSEGLARALADLDTQLQDRTFLPASCETSIASSSHGGPSMQDIVTFSR